MTESVQTNLCVRLRDEFDRSFTLGSRAITETAIELLGFRVGDGSYAVRLEQIATVQEIRNVTRIPGQASGLEGLLAVQGQLVAIYDLAVLLRSPGNALSRRWLLICRNEPQVGFAVDSIDGYLRKSQADLVAANEQHQRHLAISHALDEEPSVRLVVEFNVLTDALRRDLVQEGPKTR